MRVSKIWAFAMTINSKKSKKSKQIASLPSRTMTRWPFVIRKIIKSSHVTACPMAVFSTRIITRLVIKIKAVIKPMLVRRAAKKCPTTLLTIALVLPRMSASFIRKTWRVNRWINRRISFSMTLLSLHLRLAEEPIKRHSQEAVKPQAVMFFTIPSAVLVRIRWMPWAVLAVKEARVLVSIKS